MTINKGLLFIIILVITTLSAGGCSQPGSPESVARDFLDEYLASNIIPYRKAQYSTEKNDGTFALIRANLELRSDSSSDWAELETVLELVKINNEWIVDTNYIRFEMPKRFVLQTQDEIYSISATETSTVQKFENEKQSKLDEFFKQNGEEINTLIENAHNVLYYGFKNENYTEIMDYYDKDATLYSNLLTDDKMFLADLIPPHGGESGVANRFYKTSSYKLVWDEYKTPQLLSDNRVGVMVGYVVSDCQYVNVYPLANSSNSDFKFIIKDCDGFKEGGNYVECIVIDKINNQWKITKLDRGCFRYFDVYD